MLYCQLDIFPVELIHYLLNYFSAHEIFYTFTNLSAYIDNVLLTYSNYCVNFRSVTRKEFQSVCQRIIPDQVISLTLSDSEHTPGQIELFLSRFQINQFIRLRSLTLVEVGPDFWEPIVTKLVDLKYLRSFIYDSSSASESLTSQMSYNDLTKLDKCLFDSYSPVLPQLNRLKLAHGNFFLSVQFPYLHHLILGKCKAVDIVNHIFYAAPQLKSLEIVLKCNQSNTEFIFPLHQLNRLVLHVEDSIISMNNMEQLLAKLPNLQYLQLRGHGDSDLLDGQRWQMMASGLITFNFKFNISTDTDVQNLDSFRSPFWLIEKHWYVAYNTLGCIFSVPYFSETETHDEFEPPVLSTAPDINIFYRRITRLTIFNSVLNINHRFPEVQTLLFNDSIDSIFIEQIIDLNRIQHLILYSITKYAELVFLINEMPNLYQISIRNEVKYFLETIEGESFEKIRNLEIGSCFLSIDNTEDDFNYNIEQLCSVFPSVKNLHIEHLCPIPQMLNFINQCKQLTAASFRCPTPHDYSGDTNEHITEIQSVLNHHRSTQKLDYSYRLERLSVHIWL